MVSNEFDSLIVKLNGLSLRVQEQTITKGLARSAKLVQRVAKKTAPANNGELRRKILVKIKKSGKGGIAEVYANVKHAVFVEFGTGPEGKANHEGTNPKVNVKYRSTPWWISGSDISKQVAEKYHFPKSVSANGEVFYWTDGQKAQPYMYPALDNSKDDIHRIFAKSIREAVRRYGK